MEGANSRWKSEDDEQIRIRPRARGELSLGYGIWLLGRGPDCSDRGCVCSGPANWTWGPESQCSGRLISARGLGSLVRPASRSLRGAAARSATGPVWSTGRPPARAASRRLRHSNRSLRESSAGFGGSRPCSDVRLLASASKMPAAESVRRRQEPECRLRRRHVRSALDLSAPEPDSSARELIRCLPTPIRRLRRRIR